MWKALQEVESAESDEGSVKADFFSFQFQSDQFLIEQLIKNHQTCHGRAGTCTTCSNPTFKQCAGLEMQ